MPELASLLRASLKGERPLKQICLVDLAGIFRAIWHASAHEAQNAAFRVTKSRCLEIIGWRRDGDPEKAYDAIAFCVDAPPYKRLAIRSDYKANRQKPEPGCMAQYQAIQDWLKAQGELVWKVKGYEADDLIATACKQAPEDEVDAIDIMSNDKDLLQLVSARVRCIPTRKDHVPPHFDPPDVQAEFGVLPEMMGELLALAGDDGDNVPGVKGFGKKTAADLLKKFGSLDTLIAVASDVSDRRLTVSQRTKINDAFQEIQDSRRLVKLLTDAPIRFAEIWEERERQDMPPPPDEGPGDEGELEPEGDDGPPEEDESHWERAEAEAVANAERGRAASIAISLQELDGIVESAKAALAAPEPEPQPEPPPRPKTEPPPAPKVEPKAEEPKAEPPKAEAEAAPKVELQPQPQKNGYKPPPDGPPEDGGTDIAAAVANKMALLGSGEFSLTYEPNSRKSAWWLAETIVKSKVFPAITTAAQGFVILQIGREMGITSMAACRNIKMVKGNPMIMSTMLVGVILRSGYAEYFECIKSTATEAAWETVRRGGSGRKQSLPYTIEMAHKAGLTRPSKEGEPSNYIKRPETMLRHRAAAELARMVYPEIASGVYVYGEDLGDGIEEEPHVTTTGITVAG